MSALTQRVEESLGAGPESVKALRVGRSRPPGPGAATAPGRPCESLGPGRALPVFVRFPPESCLAMHGAQAAGTDG
ncbi:hypothetical protein GCM10010495_32010 [Kitasatospora herbaricolor]|nr:hypothetical protein GCM10010495_32010 [Kitasatospora herbaricolor]